jgi:hypothetical protein
MKLSDPIRVSDSKTVTEVTFPEKPLARHFYGTSIPKVLEQDTEAWIRVVQNATGTPAHVLEQLSFPDTMALLEELLSFLGFGKATTDGGDAKSDEPPRDS